MTDAAIPPSQVPHSRSSPLAWTAKLSSLRLLPSYAAPTYTITAQYSQIRGFVVSLVYLDKQCRMMSNAYGSKKKKMTNK